MKNDYDKALSLLEYMNDRLTNDVSDDESWLEFAEEDIYIGFGNKLCTFTNCAELFDAVKNALQLIVDDNEPVKCTNNVVVIVEETITQSFSVMIPDGEDTHKYICDKYHNEELIVIPDNIIGVSYAVCDKDTGEIITEWTPID